MAAAQTSAPTTSQTSESLETFDVVVIGAGPGGYVSAIRSAQLGFKTAIIEGHKMGGECLNYGCIPSKALITAGHTLDQISHADVMGIQCSGGVSVDLAKLISWKGTVVSKLTGGVGQLLKANGVTAFKGTGSFEPMAADGKTKVLRIDPTRDSYNGNEVSGDGKEPTAARRIQASRVVIATGSTSIQIPSMPFNGKTIIGSKESLDVTTIPTSIAIIGGGVIGLEIGSFFAKIGTQVTVIEATAGLLPGTDRECVDVVQKKLVKAGVQIMLETKALGVDEKSSKNKGIIVRTENAKGKIDVPCDWVLVTVGRKPRTANLGLEKIGLKPDAKGFLTVNNRLETIVPGVFAIGDVIGGPMLAHKASREGLAVIECMKDDHATMDIRALPWAIFVDPEIAGVGHTVESAKAAGWDPVVGKCPFAANGRALTANAAEGFVKIIADRKTDRVLGAHMVGPEVSNLVAEIALAIEMGATSEDIGRTVHTHPTLPETMMEAAESVHGLAVHIFEKKPRGKDAHLAAPAPAAR